MHADISLGIEKLILDIGFFPSLNPPFLHCNIPWEFMDWIRETAKGVLLPVRAVPRASKNEIQGVQGDALKVRLQAPPVDGKANEALIRFLSDVLDIPRSQIAVASGETGRNKAVLIGGITKQQLVEWLTALLNR
jgi:uncharacterized protein (TIGR00251 family)